MSCCSFEAQFCHKLGECFISTLQNIGTCVRITWNYFPCVVLHEVKVFMNAELSQEEGKSQPVQIMAILVPI